MIRIAISVDCRAAPARQLGYDNNGERLIWLDRAVVNGRWSLRGQGES